MEYLTVPLDLTAAIANLEIKLSMSLEDRVKRSMYCAVLSRLRHFRFVCTDERSDLAAAGSYLRSCMAQSDTDDFHESLLQTEMGVYIHARYHLLGEPALIGDAIETLESAVQLIYTSSSSSTHILPLILRELGSLLFCQFRGSQDLEHLQKAIGHLRGSISVASQDERTLISCSRLLIDTLLAKFEQSQRIEDLDEAIRQYEHIGSVIDCHPRPHKDTNAPAAHLQILTANG